MKCWHCGVILEDPPRNKIAFRAICDQCSAWLHCCKNCKHYKPGLPNDCKVPGTEPISDRETCNFCDEFELLGSGSKESVKPEDVAKRLFGEEENSPKKSFGDLFND